MKFKQRMNAFPERIVVFIELIISLLSCIMLFMALHLINCLACQTYDSGEQHRTVTVRELQLNA